jgi:hypothetical protein
MSEYEPIPPRRPPKRDNGERSAKDGPWFWANKSALEKIRTRCEDPRSTLGVYLALCEIASDEQSNNFMASAMKIASKSCLSQRTVFDRVKDLEQIGLVEIERGHSSATSRIPNAYILLKCEFNQV